MKPYRSSKELKKGKHVLHRLDWWDSLYVGLDQLSRQHLQLVRKGYAYARHPALASSQFQDWFFKIALFVFQDFKRPCCCARVSVYPIYPPASWFLVSRWIPFLPSLQTECEVLGASLKFNSAWWASEAVTSSFCLLSCGSWGILAVLGDGGVVATWDRFLF